MPPGLALLETLPVLGYPFVLFSNKDAIRISQATIFGKRYGFCTLPVLGDNAALAVESQILASPGIHSMEKVMVVVHDSPEIWADKDPISGTINPSKSLVISSTNKFIHYAMTHGFGVIDVSIPEDHDVFGDKFSALSCSQDTCVYLWDNYFGYVH